MGTHAHLLFLGYMCAFKMIHLYMHEEGWITKNDQRFETYKLYMRSCLTRTRFQRCRNSNFGKSEGSLRTTVYTLHRMLLRAMY